VVALAVAASLGARAASASEAGAPAQGGFVAAHDGRVVVALTTTRVERSLALDRGASTDVARDPLWQPLGVWLGVRAFYARGADAPRAGLRGELRVGWVATPYVSLGGLGVEHTTAWVAHLGPLTAAAGLRVAAIVDLPDAAVPLALVGPSLSLGHRAMEVGWASALSVPLHREERAVAGGTLSRGASTTLQPLAFHASIAF
jgi:hypothetical protein